MQAKAIHHGLSQAELATIRSILASCSENIESVGIFGSRANGNYKAYSDVDLVVYGSLNRHDINRLNTLFDESNIGLRVDIQAYQLISYQPLQRHIDNVSKTLFTRGEFCTKTDETAVGEEGEAANLRPGGCGGE